MKIAIALNKHDTIGFDIVNHCVNDIFCGGAAPPHGLTLIRVEYPGEAPSGGDFS